MSGYTRSIFIRSYHLGEDATLILTFDSEKTPGIFKHVFPTVWKVTEFPKAGGYMFKATFKSQLGVTRAQLERDTNIVSPAATYIPIMAGQKTTLKKTRRAYYFSEPTAITGTHKDQILAINGTDGTENLGLGYFAHTADYPPSTLLFYKGVSAGSSVQAKFQPILRAYIVSDFRENELLTRRVSSPVLFDYDLAALPGDTYLKLTYDQGTKEYKIVLDPEYKAWLKNAGYDDESADDN